MRWHEKQAIKLNLPLVPAQSANGVAGERGSFPPPWNAQAAAAFWIDQFQSDNPFQPAKDMTCCRLNNVRYR
jgi:hypothetical protein